MNTLPAGILGAISMALLIGGGLKPAQAADREPMLPIYKEPPSYPKLAFEQKIEGWVYASFTVLSDGNVDKDSIKVLDEEPAGVFTESALGSAASLKFNPGTLPDGTAIDVEGVTYLFHFAFKPGSVDSYFSDSYTGRQPPDHSQAP